MKIRYSIILLTIIIFITACSQTTAEQTNPALSPLPTSTAEPSETPIPDPSDNLPPTPEATKEDEVVLLTNEPPEVILTAMNLQLDEKQAQLTQSAEQIATMASEIEALETQVAASPTDDDNSSSGNNGQEYNIPSNVFTVVTVQKAVVFVPVDYNKQGAPVMGPYEPRVTLEPGREAWVYKSPVIADGGTPYYESFDPDGESDLKVYFKANQIQIKLSSGKPDPDNYPENVAIAKVTKNTVLFTAKEYDKQGKPVMVSYQPIIQYKQGAEEIVYPEFVIATGGEHYYPVYDPDGTPSGYLRAILVVFPLMWD